jgi:hypothetical protein
MRLLNQHKTKEALLMLVFIFLSFIFCVMKLETSTYLYAEVLVIFVVMQLVAIKIFARQNNGPQPRQHA